MNLTFHRHKFMLRSFLRRNLHYLGKKLIYYRLKYAFYNWTRRSENAIDIRPKQSAPSRPGCHVLHKLALIKQCKVKKN